METDCDSEDLGFIADFGTNSLCKTQQQEQKQQQKTYHEFSISDALPSTY